MLSPVRNYFCEGCILSRVCTWQQAGTGFFSIPVFRAAGIDTEVFELPQRMAGWSSLWSQEGDVIFVQRKRLPFSVLLFLKRLKKKILMILMMQ